MPEALDLELIHDPTVNYALQQNDVPVIKQLRLTNSGSECLKDVLVRVEVEPDFASAWEGRVTSLEPGASYAFGHVPLQLSPKFLAELTERVAGTITVSVSASGQELKQETARIDVLAYDEWSGHLARNDIVGSCLRLDGFSRACPQFRRHADRSSAPWRSARLV